MILKNIKSNINFFADDTTFFSLVKDSDISAINLNCDLDIISKEAHQWEFEFNPDPSKQATVSCKHNIPNHPKITFDGTVVAKVGDHKH